MTASPSFALPAISLGFTIFGDIFAVNGVLFVFLIVIASEMGQKRVICIEIAAVWWPTRVLAKEHLLSLGLKP